MKIRKLQCYRLYRDQETGSAFRVTHRLRECLLQNDSGWYMLVRFTADGFGCIESAVANGGPLTFRRDAPPLTHISRLRAARRTRKEMRKAKK